MSPITLVTGNPNKAKEMASILGADMRIQACDVTEIQSYDLQEIVRAKAIEAQKIIGGAVLVEDVSMDVSALGGFPGPFVKFYERSVSHDRSVQIAQALGDDKVVIRCGIGYADGERFLYAESNLPGRLVSRRGGEGFGFDPFFIPGGYEQTFAEMGLDKKNEISHRRQAVDMMREILKKEGLI